MQKSLLLAVIATLCAGAAYAVPNTASVVTSKSYVDTAVAEKQAKIPGKESTNIALTYPSTTGGTPGERTIYDSVGTSTSDTGLVTRGAVVSALQNKQDTITGGTSGSVAVYNSSGGISGNSKGIYNSTNAYSGQTTYLTQADHVNTAIKNGLNQHLSCAGWPDSIPVAERTDANCWTYRMNTLANDAVVMPQGN
ncbi:MAG: hypothetical protein J6T57_04635 [Alphaproteobacteria bacterium]|nr:hypothetical protein [Alphaproteobacteria bacterium]